MTGTLTVAASSAYAITAETSSSASNAKAVSGVATDTGGTNYGGYFVSYGGNGRGVAGIAAASAGAIYGGYFLAGSPNGHAVHAETTDTSGGGVPTAGYFKSTSTSGRGITGFASGATGTNYGGYFLSSSTAGRGVYGSSPYYAGEFISSGGSGRAVYGYATSATGTTYGGYFLANSPDGTAIYASNSGDGYAAKFAFGTVEVQEDLDVVGNLTKGGGAFLIDHPLDPANKILRHSFVESPKMMNIYTGRAILKDGKAVVALPDYFEALNHRDDREITLTCVNGWTPLYLKGKVENNQFIVQTTKDGNKFQEFSWTITAVRNDAFARQNPIIVEEEKETKGVYIHPAAFNKNLSQ